MVLSLASTIKELSDQGSCNSIHGTYETLSWMYHSSGRNCDTTAQHATIAGAIKKYLEEVNGNRLLKPKERNAADSHFGKLTAQHIVMNGMAILREGESDVLYQEFGSGPGTSR